MFAVFDTNYWGIWVVPLGVIIGFGPALAVWLREEYRPNSQAKGKVKP